MQDIIRTIKIEGDELFETREPGFYTEILTIEDQIHLQEVMENWNELLELDEEELEF